MAKAKKKTKKATKKMPVKKSPKKAKKTKKAMKPKAAAATAKLKTRPGFSESGETNDWEGSLKAGDVAPNFRIPNDSGHESGLSDFLGRQVVLYFYPKDDTPGCTCEASAFRDGLERLNKRGASVVGISCDSPESHKAFKEKYGLNFHLLSDVKRDVVKKYGVWKKTDEGDEGIERTTFLIDEEGRIKRVFPHVNVQSHYNEVLKAL